jgi:hypothetical protein
MTKTLIENEKEKTADPRPQQIPATVVVTVPANEFEHEALERLGRLEVKIDMLVGDGQPGRMTLAENRLTILERADIRRSVYDRMLSAIIAFVISISIALHDHLGLK